VHGPRGERETMCDDGNDDRMNYRGLPDPRQEENADRSENLYIEIRYGSLSEPLAFRFWNLLFYHYSEIR
jgi:hypothetical protein